VGLFDLRAPLPKAARPWLAVAAPALLLGAWCGLSYGGIVGPSFLPSPTDVLKGLLQLFFHHDLGLAIWTSTRRITIAFALAVAAAFPLGVLMGSFEVINRFFEPILAPLRFMPIVAFIPLMIVWFGIDESQKIAFLFLGVFVYLVPVIVGAIRAVPEEYVDTAYTLGASRWQVIRTVLIPGALPEIFDSFRVMNAVAWTYVVLAEGVNAGKSLGYVIHIGYTHSRTDWSFAGLVVIGGVGLLTDGLIRGVNALLFRWRVR